MTRNVVTDLLASPYFAGIGMPLLLVLLGAVAKKLVRGTGWIRQDFFLGIDLALAALSSGLIYLYELLRRMGRDPAGTQDGYEYALLSAMGFIIVAILVLFLTLTLHRDEERNGARPVRQFLLPGVVSNLSAGGLLTIFVVLVKGVTAI